MDEIPTAPAGQQSAEAQSVDQREWTTPKLKKMNLAETREDFGSGGDLFLESGPV